LRVPYLEAIAANRDSDAILLVGSVDADYTLSKLFTCILAKKPTLALFNRASLATRIAAIFPNVFVATFDETPAEPEFHASVERGIDWLRAPNFDPAGIDAAMAPWTAEMLTQAQCGIFDRVASLPAIEGKRS
jgi:hypothetical protein